MATITVNYSKYYIRQMTASEVDEFYSAYNSNNELILVFEGKEYKNETDSTEFITDYGYAYFDIEPNTQDTQEEGPLKKDGIPTTSDSLIFYLENQDYKESHPTAPIGLYCIQSAAQKPTGNLFINENGHYDVAKYATADVYIPTPVGSTTITENGTYNISEYASAVVNVNVNMCRLTVKINDPHASSFMNLSDSHAYYYTQVGKHAEKQTVTLNGSPYVTATVYLPNDGSGKCSGFFEVAVSARTGGYSFDAVNIQLTPPNSSTFTDLTDIDHNTIGYVAYCYDGDAQIVHYLFHLHDVTLGSEILIQPKIL